MEKIRCDWVTKDPIYIAYHDEEWGKPNHDSRHLFEMVCLEGQQAGLSWITILKKREGYKKAFFNFDPKKISLLTDKDVEALLQNPDIVRNKLKVNCIIKNAKAYLALQEKGIDFSEFIWSFAPEKACSIRYENYKDFPTQTTESEQLSKALKKAGFGFVGPTTCYAFMQAVGMVDDHSTNCFCVSTDR